MDLSSLLFTVSHSDTIIGVRIDQIASFRYDVEKKQLTVRYMQDASLETFEGPIAEALMRELRYGGRK